MRKDKKELSKPGIFALLLTSSLTIMVGTVIAPSLSEIAKQLGFAASPGWLITLPSLGVVIFAPVMGKLIDKKGPWAVICCGLVPYAILGAAGAFLSNPYLVIADRLLLGAATAAVQAAGSGLIAEFFHGEQRMKMMAWQGMAIEIGGVVFLSAGGVLGEIGWRYPFMIYLAGMVCLLLILRYIPRIRAGAAVITEDTGVIRSKGFISKDMLRICSSALFAMILFFVAFVGLPQYLPEAFGFSEAGTGYFMAFISLIAVVFASRMPVVSNYLGSYNTLSLGFFFFSLGLFLFSVAKMAALLYISALAMGAGFGFTVPLLNHMTVEYSNAANRGKNLGYYSMGIFGGQFLSSVLGLVSPDLSTVFKISALIALLICIALYCNARFGKATAEHR